LFNRFKSSELHVGDEWRTMSKTFYLDYVFPNDSADYIYVADSILSIANLGGNIYKILKKHHVVSLSFGNGINNNIISTTTIDTFIATNAPQVNQAMVNSMMNNLSLTNFMNDYMCYAGAYFFSDTDCNGNLLQDYYNGNQDGVLTQFQNDSCLIMVYPPSNIYPLYCQIYKEGIGLAYARDFEPSTPSYEYNMYYSNLNGCIVGNKNSFNFALPASSFNLKINEQLVR
jgi:hypothetical protein